LRFIRTKNIYIRLRKESPSSSFSDKFADCMSHEIEKKRDCMEIPFERIQEKEK